MYYALPHVELNPLGSYYHLRLKLYQNTEFDGIRRGPPKSESVAGDLHLASDAKVLHVGLNGLQHHNLRLKF